MEDEKPQYLAIKDWEEYQIPMKHGRGTRRWIRLNTDREDDPDFCDLTIFERGLLNSILTYSGRSGMWAKNDAGFIARATHAIGTDRPHIHHALCTLISRGFLLLCNQQNITENSLTRQDSTLRPPHPPTGGTPTHPKTKVAQAPAYTEKFTSFWEIYPRTNGSKAEAFKAWRKQPACENGNYETVMSSLNQYTACPQWIDGYVPHAATWINQRRWETPPNMKERKREIKHNFNFDE